MGGDSGSVTRPIAVIVCVIAFMCGSLVAHAVVREGPEDGVGWGGVMYMNKSRIDNVAKNSQTVVWTSPSVSRDLGAQVRQFRQSNGTLCLASTWYYDYRAAFNLTNPATGSCVSGNYYSRGRTAFGRTDTGSYYYFNAERTPALTFQ